MTTETEAPTEVSLGEFLMTFPIAPPDMGENTCRGYLSGSTARIVPEDAKGLAARTVRYWYKAANEDREFTAQLRPNADGSFLLDVYTKIYREVCKKEYTLHDRYIGGTNLSGDGPWELARVAPRTSGKECPHCALPASIVIARA